VQAFIIFERKLVFISKKGLIVADEITKKNHQETSMK
jgi:hypothetical protein